MAALLLVSFVLSNKKIQAIKMKPCLTVQSQQYNHNEKETGPDWGEGHHGDSTWVGNEGQPWT